MQDEQVTRGTSVLQSLMIAAMVIALGAMAFVQVNMRHEQQRTTQAIADLAAKQQTRIDALETRAATLEQDTSTLHALTTSSSKELNSALKATQKNLTQTRTTALTQIQKEHELTAEQLTSMTKDQESRFGTVNGEVTAVKSNLDETKAHLENVSSKLESAVGDLGIQSGLVARNHDELTDLKKRGERDYAEFNLKKGKDFSHISDLGLRLQKTDAKNQKYTVSVMVADKRLEKKDRTALEPVQLYMPGGHKLVEIVVWDVNKDGVVGYVSSPKF